MKTIYVIDLEPISQRYTERLSCCVMEQIRNQAARTGIVVSLQRISGGETSGGTDPGAFFDFAENSAYQSQQCEALARLFKKGCVKSGDEFFLLDAWNPNVFVVRKLACLSGLDVRLSGLWHAGSYDPNDFLGRVGDRQWLALYESALAEALDVSIFATEYHRQLFTSNFDVSAKRDLCRAGFPFEYLSRDLAAYGNQTKENLIVFPHRLAPEKQPEIFRDLAPSFPDYQFVCCQDQQLSKHEYHSLLGRARMVFSANLQETLGIGVYEGLCCGALPFAPDRLSYREMYPDQWLYPSEWTESWSHYNHHKYELVDRMRSMLSASEEDACGVREQLMVCARKVEAEFFTGTQIYDQLLGGAS